MPFFSQPREQLLYAFLLFRPVGRYKAGEKEPDPKTWKANFRCAMNSLPDIEEVKDQSRNKGSSAVRVYRMLPPLTRNQRKGSQGHWVLGRKGREDGQKEDQLPLTQPVLPTERKSKSSRDTKSKTKRKVSGSRQPSL